MPQVLDPPDSYYGLNDPAVWICFGDEALGGGRCAEAESWYRRALPERPEDADLWSNLGTAVWFLGRLDEAEDCYRRACRIQPDGHSFVNNLGNVQRARGRFAEAEASYRRALELEPEAIEARINLGVALSDLGSLEESEALLRESVALRPDIPDAHLNLGTTLTRLGRWEEAAGSYEEALRRRPDYPEAHRNLAMYRLGVGDYERGWPEYEWRRRCHGKGLPGGGRPVWSGEDLEGKTILLHAEQGFGDTIQFARYAALVRGRGAASVTLACAEPLVRLFARSALFDRVVAVGGPLPPTDYQVLLMSLPAIFGTTLAAVPATAAPYLAVDAAGAERWRRVLEPAGGFKIGIAWQGNPAYPGDSRRSFPLAAFARLAEVPGVRLIRLQHGRGSEQLDRLDGRFPVEDPWRSAGKSDWDFLDSAALIANLDLVATPDSALGHLAGALGAPVWVALPYASEWRWLRDRDDSPWYPSLRLFRQRRAGDWDDVFARISAAARGPAALQGRSSLS